MYSQSFPILWNEKVQVMIVHNLHSKYLINKLLTDIMGYRKIYLDRNIFDNS